MNRLLNNLFPTEHIEIIYLRLDKKITELYAMIKAILE